MWQSRGWYCSLSAFSLSFIYYKVAEDAYIDCKNSDYFLYVSYDARFKSILSGIETLLAHSPEKAKIVQAKATEAIKNRTRPTTE